MQKNDIAAFDQLHTPCYLVDEDRFLQNLSHVRQSFCQIWGVHPTLGYSVKTNHTDILMAAAKQAGMMAEVVSDEEYSLAIDCGFLPEQIIFNGPRKSEQFLLEALRNGSIVNLDHFGEIQTIKEHIDSLPVSALKLGLRVNFDLERLCPGETTAGESVSRFGFCVENHAFADAVAALKELGIAVCGLHMHYSSTTRSTGVFRALAETACQLIDTYALRDTLRFLDIGGGFFLGQAEHTPGYPGMPDYAQCICQPLEAAGFTARNLQLILEPGAALISTAVDYLTRVTNKRDVRGTDILTVDGSLLHINPFLHSKKLVLDLIRRQEDRPAAQRQIVCGATCMENDRLLSIEHSPSIEPGDYLLCHCAGAYTMDFNSFFIHLPPYIYWKSGEAYQLTRNSDTGPFPVCPQSDKLNLLFTSVGRRSYLVRYFKEALGNRGSVHVANSSALSPAFQEADYAVVSPLIYDEAYIPFLLQYCKEHQIKAVIPLFDIDLPVLAKNRARFDEIGVKLIVSSEHTVGICNDKWKTYQFLTKCGLDAPLTFLDLQEALSAIHSGKLHFPVIIKPRWGMGSIAIYRAENEDELSLFYQKTKQNIRSTYLKYESDKHIEESVLIQQQLDGQEYGLDVINDLDGHYMTTVVKRKYAMRAGETDCAVTVEDERAKALGRLLSEKLGHIGNLDVDVFVCENKYHVLEMNARFGGGYPFSHMAGVNLPAAILHWLQGKAVDPQLLEGRPGVMSHKDIRMVSLPPEQEDFLS